MGFKSKDASLDQLDKVLALYETVNAAELSRSLGYSSSAISNWRKAGRMPFVASLACEAFIRRKGQPKDESQGKLDIVSTLAASGLNITKDSGARALFTAIQTIIKG